MAAYAILAFFSPAHVRLIYGGCYVLQRAGEAEAAAAAAMSGEAAMLDQPAALPLFLHKLAAILVASAVFDAAVCVLLLLLCSSCSSCSCMPRVLQLRRPLRVCGLF